MHQDTTGVETPHTATLNAKPVLVLKSQAGLWLLVVGQRRSGVCYYCCSVSEHVFRIQRVGTAARSLGVRLWKLLKRAEGKAQE